MNQAQAVRFEIGSAWERWMSPRFLGRDWVLREPVTRSIEIAVLPELACMRRLFGRSSRYRTINEIRCQLSSLLDTVGALIVEGAIQPWRCVRLSSDEPELPLSLRSVKLGVFPVSGDPIHWGHVLMALTAMVQARLDKVVFVVRGECQDDEMPENVRQETVRDVTKGFEPLLSYSPVGRECGLDDVDRVFGLLGLNPLVRIDAFCIVPPGQADLQFGGLVDRVSQGVRESAKKGGSMHSVSILRLSRGGEARTEQGTPVPVRVIPGPGSHACAEEIRAALAGNHDPEILSAVPFSVYQRLQEVMGATGMK